MTKARNMHKRLRFRVAQKVAQLNLWGGGVESRHALNGRTGKSRHGLTHWLGSRKRLNGQSPGLRVQACIPDKPEAAHGGVCRAEAGLERPARPTNIAMEKCR